MNDNKHICISGASSGIGKALAEHYAASGIKLSLLARSYQKLVAIKESCEAKGAVVNVITADVCDRAQMQRLLEALDQEQAIDLLIVNAGISQKQAALEAKQQGMSGADWQTEAMLVDVHLHGTLNTLHPILLAMKQRRRGQIALMGSLNSFVVIPRSAIYGAVKAAILNYGLALRCKLAKKNIKVNVICPGWVETALTNLNEFKMPGLMGSQQAAEIIARGIAKNKAVIGFPWRTYWLCLLYQAMPLPIKLWLSKRMG